MSLFNNKKNFLVIFICFLAISLNAKKPSLKNQIQLLNLELKKKLLINSINFKYKLNEQKIYTKGKTSIKIGDYHFKSISSKINIKTKELSFDNGVKLTSANFTLECKILNFKLVNKDWYCVGAIFKTKKRRFDGKKMLKKNNRYVIDGASFTSCETCKDKSPDWSIYSTQIILKNKRSWIKTPLLKIKKLPVLALPFLSFPVGVKRAAGLLIPKIAFSKKWGWSYSQSIFVPFNIYSDLNFTGSFYKKIIKSDLEYRHVFNKNSYLNFYISQLWNEKDKTQYTGLIYNQNLEFKNALIQRLNLQLISDFKYLQNFYNQKDPLLKHYGKKTLTSKFSLTKNFQNKLIQNVNIEASLYQNLLYKDSKFKDNLTYSAPDMQYFLLSNNKYFSSALDINFNTFYSPKKVFIKTKIVDNKRQIDSISKAGFDPKKDIISSGRRLYIKPTINLNLKQNTFAKSSLQVSYNQFLYNFNPKIKKNLKSNYKASAHQSYVNFDYLLKSNLYKFFFYKNKKYKHSMEPSLKLSYVHLVNSSKHNFITTNNTDTDPVFTDNDFFNPDKVIQFDYYDNINKKNRLRFKLYSQLIKKNNEKKYSKILDFQISQSYVLKNNTDYKPENLLAEVNVSFNQVGALSKLSYDHLSKLLSTSNHIYWISQNKNYKFDINYSSVFFAGVDAGAETEIKSKTFYDQNENIKLSSLVSNNNWGLSGSLDLFKKKNKKRKLQSWNYNIFYRPDNQCWTIGFQQKTQLNQDSSYHLDFQLDI